MLSSKLLPEMEAEEATLKDKILSNISNFSMTAQSENLQVQESNSLIQVQLLHITIEEYAMRCRL